MNSGALKGLSFRSVGRFKCVSTRNISNVGKGEGGITPSVLACGTRILACELHHEIRAPRL